MSVAIHPDIKEILRSELSQLNKSLLGMAKDAEGYLGDLLSYVLAGSGKRIRPALVFLCARMGPSQKEEVFVVAEAVELIHVATLIHDDVIDKAALRRGRKTIVDEHGIDTAVLLGDYVFSYAFERMSQLNRPVLLQRLTRCASLVCRGEINQLKNRFKFDLSEEEYFSFIRGKTATLFGFSARAGGILAGQSETVQDALESFGLHLGIAFQITDDLLDLTGEESIVGKTLRTDILNGKMTLPLIHYRNRQMSTTEIKSFYESVLRPNGRVNELIQKMEEAGSMAYAERVARRTLQQALSNLEALPKGDVQDHLVSLAEMLLYRRS
ncbi:MAG: polyprenyl synthetase family protein [Elusimicrobia bacterium]|nr:polyprenyl synthetase family protein [Candidatus Obscuribacterium magneticum]